MLIYYRKDTGTTLVMFLNNPGGRVLCNTGSVIARVAPPPGVDTNTQVAATLLVHVDKTYPKATVSNELNLALDLEP